MTLIGTLVEGLGEAGFVQSSKFDDESSTLSVTLKSTAYGEIASPSKIPIAWRVENPLTFSLRKSAETEVTIDIEGLNMHPAAQSWDLYTKYMGSNPRRCIGDMSPCLAAEEKLAGDYYKKNKDDLLKGDGKISKILKGMDDLNWFVRKAINSHVPSIFYSLTTLTPRKLTKLRIDTKTHTVAGTAEPDESHANFGPASAAGLFEKTRELGKERLVSQSSTLAVAEKAAASGINFAKMLCHGESDMLPMLYKTGISAGKVDKIAKLFAYCPVDLPPGDTDPASCKGDSGRIFWAAKPGVTMT
uniref:Uncharacterized protein n=1 Tax=Chromera velia CCMP2878 TaxID=1169474 RepID=A0A0G4GDD2_9ALVE|eukprot:Cvel_21366.t1-p1 / transcript=Cvel_21366.t1 / gene=Cvel_21366 / organism=Chromera_velia_CCMP2878 / gene_product=hypothetical protein / transcript_product=hypothetical protein / location=Cvel_scaffold1998:1454-2356(+) / protein_length=301 / sequence_SO=supercontig / SO=protein_coding / is_pseudo=false